MPTKPAHAYRSIALTGSSQRHDLYFFCLYRVFEAALLALLLFSPALALIGTPRYPTLLRITVAMYLVAAAVLLYMGQRTSLDKLRAQVMVGLATDIVVATLAAHALPLAAPGIALMLLFNVGSASLLLPLRYGLGGAALAAAALMTDYVWTTLVNDEVARPLAERVMFAVSFLAIAMLTYLLAKQMRRTEALAARRSAQVADLADLNELIIRRMRSGVLLVDGDNRISVANEAAMALLGDMADDRSLDQVSPPLARRLRQWLQDDRNDETPLRLGAEQTEILPRFVRLQAEDESVLAFLDDTSMVSRRAESMTLATLGRFSASLAHEIRNPLAAISYATQLLQESTQIADVDRRMLEIIHQQCMRTNGIVESVLGLARRERANAERIDLSGFVHRFVHDYRQIMPPESGHVDVGGDPRPLQAMIDPKHLQQVLTVLLQNAMTHGMMPGEPARVTVAVHVIDQRPVIDVLDRGPGIAEGNVAQLFRPFFTTSEHGTGLGLYIASELCRANEASLQYVCVPGGGSCFRVAMPAPHALMPEADAATRNKTFPRAP